MIYIYVFIGFLVFFLLLILFLIAPAKPSNKQRAPFQNRSIAHRGLHTFDMRIPENSMAAFKAAVDAGYGIELDIQLSKDDQVVVFHDNTLNRVCNIDGRVCDYTYEELQSFDICQTEERIPLFSDVLNLIGGRVPLIVELKNSKNNKLLCESGLQLLRAYQGPYCIESFQPLIVGWFKKNAPDILRGQLSASAKEFKGELTSFQRFALGHVLTNFYTRPHFISYYKVKSSYLVKLCERLGAMRVVWTVRAEDDTKQLEQVNDTVIFEFYRPDADFTKM